MDVRGPHALACWNSFDLGLDLEGTVEAPDEEAEGLVSGSEAHSKLIAGRRLEVAPSVMLVITW